ncbi:uncharacterized protein METZ01_LOCUS169775, partial [marine metagenome]
MHRRLNLFSYLILTFSFFITLPIYSVDIKIDGVLDEADWSSAREWTKYYESMPFSLAEPKHYQKVLVQQDE